MPNTTTPMRTIVSGATTEPLTNGPKTRPKVGSAVDFASVMQMLFVLQYAMAIAKATEKAIVPLAFDVSCIGPSDQARPRPARYSARKAGLTDTLAKHDRRNRIAR